MKRYSKTYLLFSLLMCLFYSGSLGEEKKYPLELSFRSEDNIAKVSTLQRQTFNLASVETKQLEPNKVYSLEYIIAL